MRKINVILTMEVKDDATPEEIYDEFLDKDIKSAYESRDLTSFVFADADTGLEIDEVVECHNEADKGKCRFCGEELRS